MLSQLTNLDWHQIVTHLWHLVFAYALAIPIGLDREQSQRQFGLRTFPLVAVVACGFMMVGMAVIESTDGEARILQGIITGIGFIGGGAIFKDKDRVAGTASAASIWNTGAMESPWPSTALKSPSSLACLTLSPSGPSVASSAR